MSTSRAIFPGWKVVAGSAVGISFGSVPIFAAGFGILAAAMAHDFGWNQIQVERAATIYLLLQTFAYPLCGLPLARWGSRKFAVASIAAFSVAVLALSQIGNSLTELYVMAAITGVVSAGTNVVSYARAIALWFNRYRGLALGFAASAQAVGSFIIPKAAQQTIAQFGWSGALMALAAFELVICLPLVAILVKDSPTPYGLYPDGVEPTAEQALRFDRPATALSEMVHTATFWKLAICFAVMGMSFYAIAPNIVYILSKSANLSMVQIASIQATSGIAVLFGRIAFGYLLDHLHAPLVGFLAIVFSALSAAIYALTGNVDYIFLAAVAGGFGIGGETDLMPYLASRFFGAQSVSKVFGWFLFAFFLGAAAGPVAFAKLTDQFGGSSTPLLLLVGLQIVPAVLFLSLGPYPSDHQLQMRASPPEN